jgi:hypothetical protein
LTYPPGEGALVGNNGFYPGRFAPSAAGLIPPPPGIPYPASAKANAGMGAGVSQFAKVTAPRVRKPHPVAASTGRIGVVAATNSIPASGAAISGSTARQGHAAPAVHVAAPKAAKATLSPSTGLYVSELHISERSVTSLTHQGTPEPPALCTSPATQYSPKQMDEAFVFLSKAMSPRRRPSFRTGHSVKENAAPSARSSGSTAPAAPVHTVVTPFNEVVGSRGSLYGSPILAAKRPAAAVAAARNYDGQGPAVPVTPSASASLVRPTAVHGSPCPRLTHQDTAPTAAARVFQEPINAADPEELFPLHGRDNLEDFDSAGEGGLYLISFDGCT